MVIRHAFTEGHVSFQKASVAKSGELIPVVIELYLLDAENHGQLGLWAKVKRIEALSAVYLKVK